MSDEDKKERPQKPPEPEIAKVKGTEEDPGKLRSIAPKKE